MSDVKSFLSHASSKTRCFNKHLRGSISAEYEGFFPKFYLANNMFTIFKMFIAFVVSKRTHKIRILLWWYQHEYRIQKEGTGYVENHILFRCPLRLGRCKMLFQFCWHYTSIHINFYTYTPHSGFCVLTHSIMQVKQYNTWLSPSLPFLWHFILNWVGKKIY